MNITELEKTRIRHGLETITAQMTQMIALISGGPGVIPANVEEAKEEAQDTPMTTATGSS